MRINDDEGMNLNWFGTMSVAPNGRIDAVWLDTRDAPPGTFMSALYYSYSIDQGETWSVNEKLTGSFDPHVGWPQQQKMGDYYDMESDDNNAYLAWANTFNGEQDVWFSQITPDITGIAGRDKGNDGYSLAVFPNPANENVTVRAKLRPGRDVQLVIVDISGQTVRELGTVSVPGVDYQVNVNVTDLKPGYYQCVLRAGNRTVAHESLLVAR